MEGRSFSFNLHDRSRKTQESCPGFLVSGNRFLPRYHFFCLSAFEASISPGWLLDSLRNQMQTPGT
jgi:hypothetical protein